MKSPQRVRSVLNRECMFRLPVRRCVRKPMRGSLGSYDTGRRSQPWQHPIGRALCLLPGCLMTRSFLRSGRQTLSKSYKRTPGAKRPFGLGRRPFPRVVAIFGKFVLTGGTLLPLLTSRGCTRGYVPTSIRVEFGVRMVLSLYRPIVKGA